MTAATARRSGRVFFTILGTLFLSRIVQTSCYEFQLDRAFKEASAVLVGRVVSTRAVYGRSGSIDTAAILVVERRWKGPRDKNVEVTTCGHGNDAVCIIGVDFKEGDRYLVFAYGSKLETSVCSTWQLSGVADDAERRQGSRHVDALVKKYGRQR